MTTVLSILRWLACAALLLSAACTQDMDPYPGGEDAQTAQDAAAGAPDGGGPAQDAAGGQDAMPQPMDGGLDAGDGGMDAGMDAGADGGDLDGGSAPGDALGS